MTKITQSKELISFYNAYNEWLEAGAPEKNDFGFERTSGLCDSLLYYYFLTKYRTLEEFDYLKTKKQLKEQFKMSNLDSKYPFGVENYSKRWDNNTQHLDPNRIAWVKSHLTEEVDMEFILQK